MAGSLVFVVLVVFVIVFSFSFLVFFAAPAATFHGRIRPTNRDLAKAKTMKNANKNIIF